MLKRYKYLSSKLIVVSVNMVSPITGVCLDENEILSWSHEYGALCFLNYEFASSYLTIDFNHSTTDSKLQKDALYVDASKLIGGGVNCPGILLMRQKLMTNSTCHPMETPKDVLSLIRAALVLKLKDDVGASIIQRMTQRYTDRALKVWSNNSNLMLLGTNRTTPEKMKEIEDTIKGLCTSVKLTQLTPGWTTLQLHYFFDDSTVDFVVKAVDFIANNGWKFLPFYVFNEKNNEWNHRKFDKLVNPVRLSGLFHDNFSNHLNAHRKKLTDVTFSMEHWNLQALTENSMTLKLRMSFSITIPYCPLLKV
ncbi:hypothetical protein C9374_000053 [Naegleria lovaniensis]|uniref:Uncharacterized protein n=1 Tax=Naegleria lovaniensis TaxID=51637 RepID=A0AA88KP04_NAELO|nr:uncharacterized protein C9374_000053 [Naegleria lovaniensis]KAG2388614.1 hypothetical protein C9374_000053 [Naegleria lovaniensis]